MELQLKDKLPIGKFKGLPLELLLTGNTTIKEFSHLLIPPQLDYLNWFNKNVGNIIFSIEVKILLDKQLKKQRDEAWERERDYYTKNPKKSYINMNNWGNYDDRQLMMSESDYGIFY